MIKNILWLLLGLLCWSACKSDVDEPGPIDGTPYFSVRYTADSLAADSLVAGLDYVYLFTSYTTDQEGVITCTGSFSELQCLSDTCSSLRFEFRNNQLGQVVLADTVFHLGEYRYRTAESIAGQTIYRTTFQADTALGYTDFYWAFANQYFAEGSTPIVDFNDSAETARVVLRADRDSGPTSRVERRILLSGPDILFPQLDLLVSPQPNNFRLEAISTGAAISGLSWSNGITQSVFTQDSLQPDYSVMTVDTTGQVDNTASALLLGLPAYPGMMLRTANFTHTTTVVTLPADTLQLGAVALQWTDAQGQVWRSDGGPQAPEARFQVLDAGPYELNELGQNTWQMRVAFSCQLYNSATGQRISFSGGGLIAVAYP